MSSWVYKLPGYSSRRERSRRRERQEGRREGEEELKKGWPGCVSRESREMCHKKCLLEMLLAAFSFYKPGQW